MPLYHFLLIFSISHIFSYLTSVYVYSFTANGISIIYNSHSRMDDDTEADISSTDDLIGTFIPNGSYPPIMEGILFHFPYSTLSHLLIYIFFYRE